MKSDDCVLTQLKYYETYYLKTKELCVLYTQLSNT